MTDLNEWKILKLKVKSIKINKCGKCKNKFNIGDIIYRIVEQDYVKGKGCNPMNQRNKIKLCRKCFVNIFSDSLEEFK